MKSFTAKEFSRCPAKVYEAAREGGAVEITHDRFGGRFLMHHLTKDSYDHKWEGEFNNLLGHKKAPIKGLFNQLTINSYPNRDLQTKD